MTTRLADKFTCESHSSVAVLTPEGLVSQLSKLRCEFNLFTKHKAAKALAKAHLPARDPRASSHVSLLTRAAGASCTTITTDRLPMPWTSSQGWCALLSPKHHGNSMKEKKRTKKKKKKLYDDCHRCRKWEFSSLLLGEED